MYKGNFRRIRCLKKKSSTLPPALPRFTLSFHWRMTLPFVKAAALKHRTGILH